MRLGDYLRQSGETASGFARRLGVKSPATVGRYVRGQRLPAAAIMGRIVLATAGAVQPNDFYGGPDPAERPARAPGIAA